MIVSPEITERASEKSPAEKSTPVVSSFVALPPLLMKQPATVPVPVMPNCTMRADVEGRSTGIAVGLGARMPDLRESSPAKISAGFGGTLCLVLSSLYIMVLVIVAAVPTHLYLATNSLIPGARRGLLAWACSPAGFAASLLLVVAMGLVTTFVPLLAGIRSFRELEP